ncbi:MAG: TolC family protein [Acidobacteriota bacterium]|nr:TolC family protein [Acidobacteriota bacterium]
MSKFPVCAVFVLLPLVAVAQPSDRNRAPATPLADLVAQVDTSNPELAAARREVDASIARIRPAGAPPDPTISTGYMSGFLRPPFFPSSATPDGFWQFGVTQEIPYPGKLAAKTAIASTVAERARWSVELTRVGLVAALKAAYADLDLAERSLAILDGTRGVLEQAHSHADTRFRVGRGPQQDVLRAQLEISMLIERRTMLLRDRRTALAALNAVLGRSPDTEISTVPVAFDPPPPIAELQRLANDHNPQVRRDDQQIASGQAALTLARKEIRPDFAVSVTTQRKVGGMPWMYGVDLMATVPIFWQRKQRPMVAEATAMLGAARDMREATRVQADAELAIAAADAAAAIELMTLYADSILPQARLALESAMASYQTGAVDFLTLLANVTSVLTYDLASQQQHALHLKALARIEPLTGLSLIR